MKIVQLILLSIFLFAFSCKEENKNELENQLETAIESSGGKTADEWNGKLDQLFTLEMNNRKVIGTVGALQYEVIQYRLEHEYGAKCSYENFPVHFVFVVVYFYSRTKRL